MLSFIGDLTNQLTPTPGLVVARDAADSSDAVMRARGGLRPRALRHVREYILAHLEEDLSNHVLAKLVGLSAYHFSRAFKQSAGVSPHRFVLQSRVERAKHLLGETELSLAEIALIVGFGDQSHCARWFRKIVGITPSRFRWLRR